MPMCSIRQCGSRKDKTRPGLTFHRFPANEKFKKKWIEAIGVGNINPQHKSLWVCSKHFEERYFNRTLDVVRLRDNTVPSLFAVTSNSPTTSVLIENVQDLTAFARTTPQSQNITQDVACTEISNLNPTSLLIEKEHVQELHLFPGTSTQSQNITINLACTEMQQNMNKIKQLTKTCMIQRNKIKRLNEKVRKRNKKIAVLSDIIVHLKETNKINTEEPA